MEWVWVAKKKEINETGDDDHQDRKAECTLF